MVHPLTSIPIPAILEIKSGIILKLEDILKKHGFSKIIFFFDDFTNKHFKDPVIKGFKSLFVETKVIPAYFDITELIQYAFSFGKFDAMVAIGGGNVIDSGKYIAFSRKCPFISIPTSASNDGFASSNCSLIVNGKKTTVPARVPYGIIADLDIIQNAPTPFILAGVGDLMSNITALYDWDFEERNGAGSVNAFAAMISKKAVNSFIRTPMDDLKNTIFLKELVSSLTMGGISTIISGNSAPISGSEHLISHALDKILDIPEMHGLQIGIATYIMANVQNHRAERVFKVFHRTGFFDYVKTLGFKQADFREAISMAPSIKPERHTYLHDEAARKKAMEFLDTDPLLQEIFN